MHAFHALHCTALDAGKFGTCAMFDAHSLSGNVQCMHNAYVIVLPMPKHAYVEGPAARFHLLFPLLHMSSPDPRCTLRL